VPTLAHTCHDLLNARLAFHEQAIRMLGAIIAT
jgi:hypothetical protein